MTAGDLGIVWVLEALGPDLTVGEWAARLGESTATVRWAARVARVRLKTDQPRRAPRASATRLNRILCELRDFGPMAPSRLAQRLNVRSVADAVRDLRAQRLVNLTRGGRLKYVG